MHILDELEEQVKWWCMVILPVEITDSIVKPGLVIGSLTAIEDPVLVFMILFQEFDNLQSRDNEDRALSHVFEELSSDLPQMLGCDRKSPRSLLQDRTLQLPLV